MPVCIAALFFVNPNKDHVALYCSSYQNESRRDLKMVTDLLVITRSGREFRSLIIHWVNTCFLGSSLLWSLYIFWQ